MKIGNIITGMRRGEKNKNEGQDSSTQIRKFPSSIDNTSEKLSNIKECEVMLKELFEMRLIDRIARPNSPAEKEKVVDAFDKKMQELNAKMKLVRADEEKELRDESASKNMRAKSYMSTRSKMADYKKESRMLYSQYRDFFSESSFKHYEIVSKLYGLKPLHPLSINYWMGEGTSTSDQKQKRCLCC